MNPAPVIVVDRLTTIWAYSDGVYVFRSFPRDGTITRHQICAYSSLEDSMPVSWVAAQSGSSSEAAK